MRTHVGAHTSHDEWVLDPFSGRGTTVFQSLLMERNAAAIDINPVAYCVSSAKAEIPPLEQILAELTRLQDQYTCADNNWLEEERGSLPPFFRRAFYHSTLRELLFLRRALSWRTCALHRFIAALVLGSLHGDRDKSPNYFSNQMPRTISTKPAYSLRYWRVNKLWPHKREVFPLLVQRARFRLQSDLPTHRGIVALGDSRDAANLVRIGQDSVRLVVTSPPYLNVTNYGEDQWLRLWFLGFPPYPRRDAVSTDDRHSNVDRYWTFLRESWRGIAPLLRSDAIMACRIGAKSISPAELTDGFITSVQAVFPATRMLHEPVVSKIQNRQTDYFRPGSQGCVQEVDYVLALG